MSAELIQHFIVALGLGLLVGLQREWAATPVAGIRTFTLVTLLGALCAMLGQIFGAWIVAAGLISITALLFLGNLAQFRRPDFDAGITTEVAALVMYGVGAAVVSGWMGPGIAIAGAVAVLLHWKEPLHNLVRRIGEKDLRAVFRFVLIAMVILPVLPDETYGPYDVLNPFRIWLMVVLIVGISIAAYIAYKLLGARAGTVLAGLLGGLISSTAATVSYARRSKTAPELASLALVVILLASSVVFVRVLVEVAVVEPHLLASVTPPMAIMMGVLGVMGVMEYARARQEPAQAPDAEAPADLLSAIIFGALYGVVLLAVAFARDRFGDAGMYVVAGLSGLTDMDAITLSTAELVSTGKLDGAIAWRVILVGALANLVFKAGIVVGLGGSGLRRRVVLRFAIAFMAGVGMLWLWPI